LKKILVIPIFVALIMILSFLPQDAHAASFELEVGNLNGACEAIAGSWDASTNTCTITGLILYPLWVLKVEAGVTLGVETGIRNDGYINNQGSIYNYGTTFNYNTIYNKGTITNYFTIENFHHILNYGTIKDGCMGSIAGDPVSVNPVIKVCDTTSTTVTPNPATTNLDKTISFRARVNDTSSNSATNPTGTVTWSDGGAGGSFSSGSCTLAPFNSTTSVSACSMVYTPPVTTGPVTITAIYSGDSIHKASSGTSALTVS
jgi:hypothetical protein